MSNYPPGVTGNEYEIVGPDREFETFRECESCEIVSWVDVTGYGWEEWWRCPKCQHENTRVLDSEPDY